MSRRLQLIILALVSIALGSVWMRLREAHRPAVARHGGVPVPVSEGGVGLEGPSDGQGDAATQPSEKGGERVPAEIALADDEPLAAEEGAPPMLRGRVRTAPAAGSPAEPIVGATVSYSLGRGRYLEAGERATVTKTDALGHFELPIEMSGRNELVVMAPGHLAYAERVGPVEDDETLRDVLLREANVVSGRVQNEAGAAIMGARIMLIDPCADSLSPWLEDAKERVLGVTDELGEFQVPVAARSSPAKRFTLGVAHQSYRDTAVEGWLNDQGGPAKSLVVTMQAGALIRGRILGVLPADSPLAEPLFVAVEPRSLLGQQGDDWEYSNDYSWVETKPDGQFEIGGLRDGETVVLSVWTGARLESVGQQRRSLKSVAAAHLLPADQAVAELRYLPPAMVRARLMDAQGRPVESAYVGMDAAGQIRAAGAPVPHSDLAAIPGGRVEWVFDPLPELAESSTYVSADVSFEELAPENTELHWEAEVDGLVAGTVRDLGDVVLKPLDNAPSSNSGRPAVRSIAVTARSGAGAPLVGTHVEFSAAGARRPRLRLTDAAGLASLHVPADFNYRVRLAPPSYGLSHGRRVPLQKAPSGPWWDWTAVPAGTQDVQLSLTRPRPADVEVYVTCGAEPLTDASVMLHRKPEKGDLGPITPNQSASPSGLRTDALGRCSKNGVIPGAWQAVVHHPQFRMSESFDVTLKPGPNVLKLERSMTVLTGRVVGEGGEVPTGLLLRSALAEEGLLASLHERDPHRITPRLGANTSETMLRDIRFTQASADGTFRLEGVTPNVEIKALAMAPDYLIAASEIAMLDLGETVDVGDLKLIRAGSLEIRLPLGWNGDANLERALQKPQAEEDALDPVLSERWSRIYDARKIEHLYPGTWSVHVRFGPPEVPDDEASVHDGEVVIRAGGTAVLDLRSE